MEKIADRSVRQPGLIQPSKSALCNQTSTWSAQGQNFVVAWHQAGAGKLPLSASSEDEIMVLVMGASATISGNDQRAAAESRSICILPAGSWELVLEPGGTCVVLTSLRGGVCETAVNRNSYIQADSRIDPIGTPYRPVRQGTEIRVLNIDEVKAPSDKPRLKMLQSATLSINWVEYNGPRNRAALSPHAHKNFEQGSLALEGNFTHHLRVEWGENANLWREDEHVTLGSPSLLVVPVGLIHTTEGVGDDRHLLIDIFSPPRADFIAKGWIFNSQDYVK
jgi:mannose-6-phosphate isomerase-like protein (cupin superfamily)